MKSVTARFRAQGRLTLVLVLLVALAVAFLPFRPLMAASSATAGQSVATPTATMAGHAAMDESPAHAAGASHGEMPTAAVDDHVLPVPTANAATGHADATPTVAAAGGHAAAGESSSHASSEGHGEQMTGADAHAETGHADAPEVESAAHGHGAEAPSAASSTRSLALGGFGAVNGLVIVVAAVLKTRTTSKAKTRRVNQPDATTGGVSQ